MFVLLPLGGALCQDNPAAELEPIVVTKSSAAFTAQGGESLFKSLPIDVQSRSSRNIQADFSLRGAHYEEVGVFLNGQRVNDPQTGHHNGDIPFTKEDIEEITTKDGTLNFLLKKGEGKKFILETSLGNHRQHRELLSLTGKTPNSGARLSLEQAGSAGFRDDTDYRLFNLSSSWFWETPYAEFDLNTGYQQKEFGAYDFYTPGLGYLSKEWTRTHIVDAGASLDTGLFTIKPRMLWRRHYDKFVLDKTGVRSKFLSQHRTDIYTPSILLQKETLLLGVLGLGTSYSEEKITSTTLGSHARNKRRVFIEQSKDFNRQFNIDWTLEEGYDDGDSLYTVGHGMLRYEFSCGQALIARISRYVRIPSFTELYYNDPTTVGNAGLKPEKTLAFETGYNFNDRRKELGMTFFLRNEHDVIDWVKHNPSQAQWQAQNINEPRVFGVECLAKYKLTPRIQVLSNYTYTNKRQDKIYLYKYGLNFACHLAEMSVVFDLPFGRQSVGLVYKKKPGRNGWLLFDSQFSYNLNKNWRAFVDLSNIFNSEYQEIAGIPQPGREIEAGVRLEW